MKGTRSASRQPSAGPSRRPKGTSFPEGVIELTDSDDEQPAKPPPQKRQKVPNVTTETIDLTFFESVPSPTSSSRKSSFNAKAAKAQVETAREKGKEKAFTDVTNDQNIQGARPSSTSLGSPVVPEVVQEAPVNPLDHYLSQVLEVVPDVQPEHARSLLIQHHTTFGTSVVAMVLHVLFEESYPRIERNKGKRKREESESGATENYASTDRAFEGGEHYYEIALNQLTIDFPRIPVPHIRQTLQSNKSLYSPTHLLLREQLKQESPPFRLKTLPTRPSGKGKYHDLEFDRELAWLLEALKEKEKVTENDDATQHEDNDNGEYEDGIECGCCFSTYAFDKMAQCPDAHLFCKGCMRSYVENKLGQHDPNIVCMDQSGCKLPFAEAELRRIVSPKLLELYERVKQTKEIEAAELDGLEECPFCEYKVVIENPEEKLFRCEREECGAVSCRACKKLDHLPKSCKEAEEDKGLNARHKVEEAMTEALMRNCPKCKKAFVKEGGCNKMTCPHCRTVSCYVCRQVIKGYDHFDSRPPGQNHGAGGSSKQKCRLWDTNLEQHHHQEVAAARERAIKDLETEDPEVDKKLLEVELPKTKQDANNPRAGQRHLGGVGLRGRLGLAGRLVPEMPRIAPPLPPVPGVAQAQQGAMLGFPRLGINFDFQFGPLVPDINQLFQQEPLAPVPVQEEAAQEARRARHAAFAARREAIQRANDEARRRTAERQQQIRQQYEARRRYQAEHRQHMQEILQHQQQQVHLLQQQVHHIQQNNAHARAFEGVIEQDPHAAQQLPPVFVQQAPVHMHAPPPRHAQYYAAGIPGHGIPLGHVHVYQPQAAPPLPLRIHHEAVGDVPAPAPVHHVAQRVPPAFLFPRIPDDPAGQRQAPGAYPARLN